MVAALAACQKSDKLPTTAERLKNVEVRQQVEPESYLPRKSVDYMATMKDLKDAPDKPDAAKAEPKAARIAVAPADARRWRRRSHPSDRAAGPTSGIAHSGSKLGGS